MKGQDLNNLQQFRIEFMSKNILIYIFIYINKFLLKNRNNKIKSLDRFAENFMKG